MVTAKSTFTEHAPYARPDAFHSTPTTIPYRYTCLQDPHFTNEETEAEKGQVTGIEVKERGIKATRGTNGEAGLRIQALGLDPASLGVM